MAGGSDRGFHLAWHDCTHVKNLIATSRVIGLSARAREDSRGALIRENFPDEIGDAASSHRVVVREHGGSRAQSRGPERFTRVAPGQTLLPEGL